MRNRLFYFTVFKVRSLHVFCFYLVELPFKLYDFGQTFWLSFHKLLTILWGNFEQLLLTEMVVKFAGYLALSHVNLFSSAQTFFIKMRWGHCSGHSKTLTLTFSLNHFLSNLVAWELLSVLKTHLCPSFDFLQLPTILLD